MPADRTPGAMDNPYYGWSPLVTRPPLRWPEDARVALCVIVTLGHVEWRPPENVVVPPSATRVGPYPEVPDIHETSPHDIWNAGRGLPRYGSSCEARDQGNRCHGRGSARHLSVSRR